MFNLAECSVNWEKGNVNPNKGKVLGCAGHSHEQGMLQEPGNPGPGWGQMRHKIPAVGRGERRFCGSSGAGVWHWSVRKGRRGTKSLSSWEKSEVAATRNSASVI